MAGATRTQRPSSQPAFDETRQEHNNLVDDDNYHHMNYGFGSAGLAIATVTSQVKSTIAAVVCAGGAFTASKAATDNEWTLGVAGSNTNVATGFTQKYLLLRDAANVPTVQEGIQALTAAGVTFGPMPAGKACVGVMTVVNTSGANFVPGTTLLGAAGIATTFVNGVDPVMLRAAKISL
jgi:hypothetical protein